jgi:hypothetical protein
MCVRVPTPLHFNSEDWKDAREIKKTRTGNEKRKRNEEEGRTDTKKQERERNLLERINTVLCRKRKRQRVKE